MTCKGEQEICYESWCYSLRSTPGNSWWGCAARFSESWPYFRPKNVIFHTRFQTRLALKSTIPIFRPGPKAEIMSSFLGLECKQKFLRIHFKFIYFFFVLMYLKLKQQLHSYSPVVPSKTIPYSRPKWAKCLPVFRPKRTKNHTLWSGMIWPIWGSTPPPPPTWHYRWEKLMKESVRKLSNFNFQWTKTLCQNNLKNIALFFTFFKGCRCN